MEQSIRKKKNNNQINIVLNTRTKAPAPVPPPKSILTEPSPKHEMLKQIEEEMSKLVGMNEVKSIIKEIYAWIYVNKKKRQETGLKAEKQVLHMLFLKEILEQEKKRPLRVSLGNFYLK
ncbi:hypothetical protein GCM10020331_049460 [Ectobacillus funiculus]